MNRIRRYAVTWTCVLLLIVAPVTCDLLGRLLS